MSDNRVKVSSEYVLAAQLNQARETVATLLNQVAEQEQTIAALHQRLAQAELRNIKKENEKLRDQYGLKLGSKLEQDENGDWWLETNSDQP